MTTRLTSTNVATVSERWGCSVRRVLAAESKTLDALAERVGVSRQYLTKVIDGDKPTIPVETYLAICECTDLDPNRYATPTARGTPPWDSKQ